MAHPKTRNGMLELGILFMTLIMPLPSFAQDYTIRERDVLKITVYEHPDLSLSLRVSADGTITFPLLGSIRVAGMTEADAQEKLRSMLADGFIVNPQVSILVEEYRDYIYVTGEVKKPGAYRFEEGMTILKAVTLAGGFTDRASKGRMKVLRTEQDSESPVTAGTEGNNVDSKSNHTTREIRVSIEDAVIPNDIIIVPESFF